MNLPDAFLSQMQEILGGELPDFLQSLSQLAPVSIRLNPSKSSSISFEKNNPVAWHPAGFYLPERPIFTFDPIFHAGAYYVQEASSMFIFEALRQAVDLSKPLKILDLCAAPGGKTTLLLSATSPESFVLANEVIRTRLPVLRLNLEKWGYPNAAVSSLDSSEFSRLKGFFDVVLVDAPCSGEGLFRKDEGAVREWSENNVRLCAARQQRILSDACELVKPGGILLYSTCTFNVLENENNVAWMLERFDLEEVKLSIPANWGVAEEKMGYQFYPHRVRGEGFFLAVLKRKAGDDFRMKTAPAGSEKKLDRKLLETLAPWIETPESLSFQVFETGEVIALPAIHAETARILQQSLKKCTAGTQMGYLKKKDFVPSHALALSNLMRKDFSAVEMSREQALRFLKKETPDLPGLEKGWHLARFGSLNLGWMKVLDNRINNYLPNEWRIRMDLPE
ncbi:MAG: RNA methyltransferase [Bacteroidota bacterium]